MLEPKPQALSEAGANTALPNGAAGESMDAKVLEALATVAGKALDGH